MKIPERILDFRNQNLNKYFDLKTAHLRFGKALLRLIIKNHQDLDEKTNLSKWIESTIENRELGEDYIIFILRKISDNC